MEVAGALPDEYCEIVIVAGWAKVLTAIDTVTPPLKVTVAGKPGMTTWLTTAMGAPTGVGVWVEVKVTPPTGVLVGESVAVLVGVLVTVGRVPVGVIVAVSVMV